MIQKITVSGFKSLNKFRLNFRKGLNVLIGPNGAGKTNICQALGMISAVCDNSIAEYIISVGGKSSLSTLSSNQSRSRLKIGCVGNVKNDLEKESIDLKYKYSLTLRLKTQGMKIYYEKLEIQRLTRDQIYKKVLTASRNSKGNANINIVDLENIGPLRTDLFQEEGKREFNLRIPEMMGFLSVLSVFIYACHLVNADLSFSRAWNIDPYLAKRPTDVLEPSSMLSDGRRMANALHEMEKKGGKEFEEMSHILARILPGFRKINVVTKTETMLNSFSITDHNDVTCPANCLSDGTIKTIALLVGVYGQNASTNIIEEPENYLHPWACQLLIRYLRDHFQKGVCIITTHSETILNLVFPKEIVIVENENGFTKAARATNKSGLKKAISESGFGCGYHYVAGNLGGTPE
ncbi:MAG: AAA family ATPase [Candidatus Krumholzibacteriota bacterium]|nr:AAA family ATPase [Candidatus Krumholzibacteriota bacterium]